MEPLKWIVIIFLIVLDVFFINCRSHCINYTCASKYHITILKKNSDPFTTNKFVGFRHFSILRCLVKFLQSSHLFGVFRLSYCSAGVTEPYPILILCETKPYLNTFSNYTLSQYNTELYPIFINYRPIPYLNPLSRTIPYLKTPPNYTPF